MLSYGGFGQSVLPLEVGRMPYESEDALFEAFRVAVLHKLPGRFNEDQIIEIFETAKIAAQKVSLPYYTEVDKVALVLTVLDKPEHFISPTTGFNYGERPLTAAQQYGVRRDHAHDWLYGLHRDLAVNLLANEIMLWKKDQISVQVDILLQSEDDYVGREDLYWAQVQYVADEYFNWSRGLESVQEQINASIVGIEAQLQKVQPIVEGYFYAQRARRPQSYQELVSVLRDFMNESEYPSEEQAELREAISAFLYLNQQRQEYLKYQLHLEQRLKFEASEFRPLSRLLAQIPAGRGRDAMDTADAVEVRRLLQRNKIAAGMSASAQQSRRMRAIKSHPDIKEMVSSVCRTAADYADMLVSEQSGLLVKPEEVDHFSDMEAIRNHLQEALVHPEYVASVMQFSMALAESLYVKNETDSDRVTVRELAVVLSQLPLSTIAKGICDITTVSSDISRDDLIHRLKDAWLNHYEKPVRYHIAKDLRKHALRNRSKRSLMQANRVLANMHRRASKQLGHSRALLEERFIYCNGRAPESDQDLLDFDYRSIDLARGALDGWPTWLGGDVLRACFRWNIPCPPPEGYARMALLQQQMVNQANDLQKIERQQSKCQEVETELTRPKPEEAPPENLEESITVALGEKGIDLDHLVASMDFLDEVADRPESEMKADDERVELEQEAASGLYTSPGKPSPSASPVSCGTVPIVTPARSASPGSFGSSLPGLAQEVPGSGDDAILVPVPGSHHHMPPRKLGFSAVTAFRDFASQDPEQMGTKKAAEAAQAARV